MTGNDQVPVYDDKAEVRDTLDLSGAQWRRPDQGSADPRSGTNAPGAIEVAFVEGYIALRNSADPDGAVLIYTPQEWDAFLDGVRNGEFSFDDPPAGSGPTVRR